jgi:hypothetical protein
VTRPAAGFPGESETFFTLGKIALINQHWWALVVALWGGSSARARAPGVARGRTRRGPPAA